MRTDSGDPLTQTLPISPLQEGIWLFWRLNPTSPGYSMPEIIYFDGDFDLPAAEFTFNEIIRRHEALRTTFHERDSGVVQIIDHAPEPVPVKVVDLRELPEEERTERLESTLHTAANSPFDLTTESPIRLTVIRVSARQTTLVLVANHIVCDGISMGVLLQEFGAIYQSARRGAPSELGPPPPGYGTFVQGQLAAAADGGLAEESAFWRKQLAGATGSALPGAESSGSRSPEARDTFMLSITLDDELTDSLTAFTRQVRATPFSVTLCAMQVMIAAATGDEDIALGTATSGRTPKFERTVGLLANIVVARSRIDLSKSFATVLEEVSLDLMDAIDHQDLAYSRMVGELHDAGLAPDTEMLRTTFSAGAGGSLNLGEGELLEVTARTVEGAFELAVSVDFAPTGVIALDWEFALRSYSHDVARGYCAAYLEILDLLLRQPDAPLDSLALDGVLARVPLPSTDGPSPAATGTPTAAEPAEPGEARFTAVEEAIASIWSEVIGVPVLSPYDDFFDLGGHSILAMESVAAVRRGISESASLRMLFDHPQLREFASLLDPGAGTARS